MTASPPDDFLSSFVAAATASRHPPAVWMRALTRTYIRVHGLPVPPAQLVLFDGVDTVTDEVEGQVRRWTSELGEVDVDVLGHAHEALLDARQRHRRGVFYTPADVAAALVGLVLPAPEPQAHRAEGARWASEPEGPPTLLDPASGGGAFLLAAARHLEDQGWSRVVIVEQALWGVDIDPLAVGVADAVLRCWAAADESAPGKAAARVRTNLLVGDTLADGPAVLAGRRGGATAPPEGFDAVVGNPPFQNQLSRGTARDASTAAAARTWSGAAAHRYADTSTVFVAAALQLARPGGRVGLILPQSFLAADDAAAVRDGVLATAAVEHLWVANEAVFAANVRVCAPVLRRHASKADEATVGARSDGGATSATTPVRRWWGRAFAPVSPIELTALDPAPGATWAPLVADLFGVPTVGLAFAGAAAGAPSGCLGDFCDATAGFRDQYYGLVPHVREADADEVAAVLEGEAGNASDLGEHVAPLLTCGLIGPVWSDWGRRPTKFAKRTWQAPVVDLATLAADDPSLHRWAQARRVPKLVLATQTRVVEAVVDDAGRWYPSVPSIALTCAPDRLWAAAAVLLAPAVTLWAFRRHAGAALSNDALKVSARQVLAAPLPTDPVRWERAAACLAAAHRCAGQGDPIGWRHELEEFARESAAAYDLPPADADAVTAWWLARLPDPIPPRSRGGLNPDAELRPERRAGALAATSAATSAARGTAMGAAGRGR